MRLILILLLPALRTACKTPRLVAAQAMCWVVVRVVGKNKKAPREALKYWLCGGQGVCIFGVYRQLRLINKQLILLN